ncbi:hypothetical protein [Halorubrum trueperi]|uniref:DUF1102 domain-containing protein n=1 Tax=Halorubrum trueperi TaxID=2004704 RepID=A0ABD5ULQ0_9EURY
MAKRRSMLLGLGALATGSGAVFSSASFTSSADSSADFRVVVEDDLIAEAGESFRDGEEFDPDEDMYYDISSESLFSGGDDDIDGTLNTLEPGDLPAVGANAETNEDLAFEVATMIDTSHDFDGFLRIRNEGTEDKDVGITFTPSDTITEDGPLTLGLVQNTYQFKLEGGMIISPNPSGNGDGDSDPANFVTIPAGGSENVALHVNTEDQTSKDLTKGADLDDLDPFSENGEHATIDLVDEIVIGTSGDQNNPEE